MLPQNFLSPLHSFFSRDQVFTVTIFAPAPVPARAPVRIRAVPPKASPVGEACQFAMYAACLIILIRVEAYGYSRLPLFYVLVCFLSLDLWFRSLDLETFDEKCSSFILPSLNI